MKDSVCRFEENQAASQVRTVRA